MKNRADWGHNLKTKYRLFKFYVHTVPHLTNQVRRKIHLILILPSEDNFFETSFAF